MPDCGKLFQYTSYIDMFLLCHVLLFCICSAALEGNIPMTEATGRAILAQYKQVADAMEKENSQQAAKKLTSDCAVSLLCVLI